LGRDGQTHPARLPGGVGGIVDEQPTPQHEPEETGEQSLFKKYPKLGVILVAAVAYAILIGMCLTVLILAVRGV
jgi:hypothetical protein